MEVGQNIEDLLATVPLKATETDAIAALAELDLGGKTFDEAQEEEKLAQEKVAAQEEEKKEEPEQTISRKDTAVKALVNFDDLANTKTKEEET